MAKSVQDIEEQINKLINKKKKVEDRRKTLLFKIIVRCGATDLPDDLFAGALSEIVKAYGSNDKRINIWKQEGQRILHPGRRGRKKKII